MIEKEKDLINRTFSFAVKIIKLIRLIEYKRENEVLKYQLAKAGTSIGANYEEAQGAFSKEDFNYKISICLKEARETHYWLRLLKSSKVLDCPQLDEIINESEELKKIFGSIVKKTKKR